MSSKGANSLLNQYKEQTHLYFNDSIHSTLILESPLDSIYIHGGKIPTGTPHIREEEVVNHSQHPAVNHQNIIAVRSYSKESDFFISQRDNKEERKRGVKKTLRAKKGTGQTYLGFVFK